MIKLVTGLLGIIPLAPDYGAIGVGSRSDFPSWFT